MDVGASFYPEIGPYSSTNVSVIKIHMQQLYDAGVGVLCYSWYPPQASDEEIAHRPGFSDSMLPRYLDAAAERGITISLHVEPYKGRNEMTLKRDIKYVYDNYGGHKGFHRCG